MWSERSNLGSQRPNFWCERLYLRPEIPDFGPWSPDFGSERPDQRSEWPNLGLYRLDFGPGKPSLRFWGGTDRRTDRHTETGENCSMWNHRSSAPPGPLPKKCGKERKKC